MSADELLAALTPRGARPDWEALEDPERDDDAAQPHLPPVEGLVRRESLDLYGLWLEWEMDPFVVAGWPPWFVRDARAIRNALRHLKQPEERRARVQEWIGQARQAAAAIQARGGGG